MCLMHPLKKVTYTLEKQLDKVPVVSDQECLSIVYYLDYFAHGFSVGSCINIIKRKVICYHFELGK